MVRVYARRACRRRATVVATRYPVCTLARVHPRTLDHVALWLVDRDRVAELLTTRFGMHVISRTDAFTLVGANARHGKLTLFAADGPREQAHLKHVALRVSDAAAAARRVGGGATRADDGVYDLGEGLRIALVEAPTAVDYDLDHVALF